MPVPGHVWPGQLLGITAPHVTVVADGQLRMHSQRRSAALQRCPDGHWVPTPQTGPPGQLLGMSVPHATVPGVVGGHEGTHSQRPMALQRSPGLQRVPTPGHDAPEQALRTGCPQSTVLTGGHIGMHSQTPATQRLPEAQRVPVPQEGPPAQTLGTGAPQSTPSAAEAGGQRGAHSQRRASVLHCSPGPQPVLQRPPQPSSEPQGASAAQCGVHEQVPATGSQVCRGSAQVPMQRPPQPSSAPQAASAGQRGSHTQRPKTQRSFAPRLQGVAQPQVSMQVPFEQIWPSGQRTPAQGLATHIPRTHTSPIAQVTPSQGEGAKHETWQAKPSGHGAAQRWRASHRPDEREQYSPSAHTTPAHGAGKQPATQRPSRQVSLLLQRTPPQGSRTGTHCEKQRSMPQTLSIVEHGSVAQRPPMQR